MSDYYKMFPILMTGDFIARLLAPIVDDPEFSAYSLKDSAGVDSKIKTVEVIGKKFKLQFFDVSKQQQFEFLRSKFKPYAIIIVYDATAIESFEKAKKFLQENVHAIDRVYILLVGYDNDLDDNDENKVVKRRTAEELASDFDICFIETSAEDPTNLNNALLSMTELIESNKIYKTEGIQMVG